MGNVRSMFGWDWVRVNAAALAVVVAIVGGLTSAIWYLGTLMGTLAPTASVAAVDEKVEALNVRVETLATTDDVEALNVRVETLATTDDVEALNVKVNQLQAMFPLMMSCIIEISCRCRSCRQVAKRPWRWRRPAPPAGEPATASRMCNRGCQPAVPDQERKHRC